MVADYKRIDLLVAIAKLYYEHNYSQSMIAKKLGLSRPYISKLLHEAKEAGIVTITVNDPSHAENWMEREIRQRFALRKVIVVPRSIEEAPIAKIGLMCARYLSSIVSSGDIIGVSWGKTMYSCAQRLTARHDLQNVTVVQLCGAISNLERNIYASEVTKLFADAFTATPFTLPLPAVMDDIRVKETVVTDRNISGILDLAKRSNIAVFTTGVFGRNSALAQAGYLLEDDIARLESLGAVGDICCHIINEEGEICDPELDRRTIGVPLSELKKKDYRIVVAEGKKKIRSICAALRRGYANVLVTDEDTITGILEYLNKS